MPISKDRFKRHLAEWQDKAGRPYWPKYLFHYADATAVAAILREGALKCRSSQEKLICDVAEPGALATNPQALDYVRLHFRPLNQFNLSTEGIKFRNDPYRRPTHMSLPIALLLDAEAVLTSPNVGFCGRKLAHIGEEAKFDEAGFNEINFADVYHDGNPGLRGKEINDRRTAEVIVPERLALRDTLKFVFCRTTYDEMTLRFLSGNADPIYLKKIRVAANPTELFFCWGTFVQLLEYSGEKIRLKLFQGRQYTSDKNIRCQITQTTSSGRRLHTDFEDKINNSGVEIGGFASDSESTWKIDIEEALAFNAKLPHTKSELVLPD